MRPQDEIDNDTVRIIRGGVDTFDALRRRLYPFGDEECRALEAHLQRLRRDGRIRFDRGEGRWVAV